MLRRSTAFGSSGFRIHYNCVGTIEIPTVLIGHYSGYIAALSTRTSYDPQGCPHSQVDDDLRRRLETKLIIAILDFDLT